jgi:hypothetical protein
MLSYLKTGQCKNVIVLTGNPHDAVWKSFPRACIIGNDAETRARLGLSMDPKINVYDHYITKVFIPWAKTCGPIPTCVLADDLTGKTNFSSAHWNEIVTDFRHFCMADHEEEGHCTFIFSIHYAFKIPPVMREASTHAGLFMQQSFASINALYESFGQMACEKYNDFKDYLNAYTDRERKVLLWYTKNPPQGQYMFQPVIAPRLPNFDCLKGEKQREAEELAKRKRKRLEK